jgi:hypothetical protein
MLQPSKHSAPMQQQQPQQQLVGMPRVDQAQRQQQLGSWGMTKVSQVHSVEKPQNLQQQRRRQQQQVVAAAVRAAAVQVAQGCSRARQGSG